MLQTSLAVPVPVPVPVSGKDNNSSDLDRSRTGPARASHDTNLHCRAPTAWGNVGRHLEV